MSRLLSRINCAFVILFLLVPAVQAGNAGHQIQQDKKEIRWDRRQFQQTSITLNKLTDRIDIWHDAWLKGDNKATRRNQVRIEELIRSDIRQSQEFVKWFEGELAKSRSHRRDGSESQFDVRDDRFDLAGARRLYRVKQQLATAMGRTDSFSNKYRLLGDYQEVLRRELRLTTVELAEDVSELNADRSARWKR
ncbi:MAG: hypothetical protein ACE5FH_12755 [Candidatus Zixiibacteriota bacterium]